jgi:hypothetical protein
MDSKRTSDQQKYYDALHREFYRERMKKYDEEYYAAREKREEKAAEKEMWRMEFLKEQKEAVRREAGGVSASEERFNFLTKLFAVVLFGGFGVGFIYVGFEELGTGLAATIVSVLAILLGIGFLMGAWKAMGTNFLHTGKKDKQ